MSLQVPLVRGYRREQKVERQVDNMGFGPPDWSINSTPAASAQATCTKAANAAFAHVCTSISATLSAVTGQTLIQLNLRDGASGAGTILWSKQVVLPAGAIWEVNLTNLLIRGTNGNAMTLEFSGAPVATNVEAVSMTGYDAA